MSTSSIYYLRWIGHIKEPALKQKDFLGWGVSMPDGVVRFARHPEPKDLSRTTDSQHSHPVTPNRLNRDFQATRSNEKWLADITYIPTAEGWLYLAVVLDLFSRKIVGWAFAATLESCLVEQAFQMAVQDRPALTQTLY